ncbi:MAG TPA: choice-of-anchor tandem repeat GloVer-containing protein [Rhizomicrobium sp.]|nr:choice-of-anchor tandem repeat GloVer-containing protein [Rhizomicrobium sp.]
MLKSRVFTSRSSLALALVLSLAPCVAQGAEKVLHAFLGGTDGFAPASGLTLGSSKFMYGTTMAGGDASCPNNNQGSGCGIIFRVDTAGEEKVLYVFSGGNSDGAFPQGGLIADNAGNYYGVTGAGGPDNAGTVYKLASDGTESIVYAFLGGSDGNGPTGNLALDSNGNLYGATNQGGNLSCSPPSGCGTVFEISPGGTLTVLHTFQGGTDGETPLGGVIFDSSGNLYGTTWEGGNGADCGSSGCGTVFKIAPDGTETILHAFPFDGSDGAIPESTLTMDGSGNLFGTTIEGGTCLYSSGCGTVFKVAPDGTETVLYSFQAGDDGYFPFAGVVMDSKGNLYGTTKFGGSRGCKKRQGCGTVFKLTPAGKESVLFAFKKGHGGYGPVAPLLLAGKKLYGTALQGGKGNNGVVFEVKK